MCKFSMSPIPLCSLLQAEVLGAPAQTTDYKFWNIVHRGRSDFKAGQKNKEPGQPVQSPSTAASFSSQKSFEGVWKQTL